MITYTLSDMQAMEQHWESISRSMIINGMQVKEIHPFQQMTVEILSLPGQKIAMVILTYTLNDMETMA